MKRQAGEAAAAIFVTLIFISAVVVMGFGWTRWAHVFLGVFLVLVGLFLIGAGVTCAAGWWKS